MTDKIKTVEFPETDPIQIDPNERIDGIKILPFTIVNRLLADNSITAAKISSITWDKAVGGTLTLGGAANVSGTFSLKDASGVEKISMDNTGMTITDGKVTIKNSSATTIIDATGLVSTANFASNSVDKTSNQTITGVGDTDITGLTLSVVLTRTTKVLISCTITGYHNDFDGLLTIHVWSDSDYIGPPMVVGQTASATAPQTVSTTMVLQMTTGTHALKVTATGNNSSPSYGVITATSFRATLAYVVLGT